MLSESLDITESRTYIAVSRRTVSGVGRLLKAEPSALVVVGVLIDCASPVLTLNQLRWWEFNFSS